MGKTIDYYLSLVSPWTYLGASRLEKIAREKNAEIRVKPMSLAIIFPQSGGLPLPKRAPQRQAYRLVELERWSKYLGEPINLHPKFFPNDEKPAAYCVIALGEAGGDSLKLAHAVLRAVWVEERDISDEATLAKILEETGNDAAAVLSAAKDPAVAKRYEDLSQEALEAGVFGSPSYVVDGELFWGQDRLDFLERAL